MNSSNNNNNNSNNDGKDTDSIEKGATMMSTAEGESISASVVVVPVVEPKKVSSSLCSKLLAFYWENEFLLLVILAILLARAYPPLGAEYLVPDITASWICVCIIFFMAGLGLKTEEFYKAFQQVWFNLFVQTFNFGVVSCITFLISWGLQAADILSEDLANGMVICASLPVTINMVLVLTKSSGGDESLAVVNAAFGNLLGVFLSPVLILMYLGVTGDIQLGEVFYKLALRVVLPVAVGQIVQKTQPKVVAWYKDHKKLMKRFQEYALVYIVYTVFCTTFADDEASGNSTTADVFKTIAFLFLILVGLMALAWISLGLLFHDHPEMRVMGLFGCTHKTVAMGVPLIGAIYEDTAAVGLYTLPLLIWHPMQLMIGTFLAPRLAAWVGRENIRLGKTTVVTTGGGGGDDNEEDRHENLNSDDSDNATQRNVEEPPEDVEQDAAAVEPNVAVAVEPQSATVQEPKDEHER